MPPKVELRNQRLSDAKRFFEILSSPAFSDFYPRISSLDEEKEFLGKNAEKRKKNMEYNYAILYDGMLVGACGIKIDQHRKFTGEIGYFVDSDYWGRGIATKAVKLLEKIGFQTLGLRRIEILMSPDNAASEKVAIKCGYKKEGKMRKALQTADGFSDAWLYAKVR